MLKIGILKLKSNLILAPMAGVSDLPFRMLNRQFGCELAFVEMLNCRSLSHKSKKTSQMLTPHPKDRPLGVQILGKEPQYILRALEVLKKYKFDLLDFNAACPARKVVRRGEGAALMQEPRKLAKIIKLIVQNSWVPVTVKIRAGWDKDSVNAKEVALLAEDSGIDALFIHGRTREQEYRGQVDYGVIKRVAGALKIPVIASGDIFSSELIQKMFAETGCAGVAVARGALGNPWIFQDRIPEAGEVIKIMLKHLKMNVDFYGERSAVLLFRKFFAWYTHGLPHVRQLREKASKAKTEEEMGEVIRSVRSTF